MSYRRFPMFPNDVPNVGSVNMPELGIHFRLVEGVWGPRFRALVDTGCSITLADLEIADKLGIDVRRSPEVVLEGVGGESVSGHIADVDLRLGSKTDSIVLRNTSVMFTSSPLLRLVLLGQYTFFQSLVFVQRNHGSKPEFGFRLPQLK